MRISLGMGYIEARMAEIFKPEQRIFLFSTCQSHMFCEEAFYRAGRILLNVNMFHPMILQLHENARLNSMLERMPELAFPFLDEYDRQPSEMLIVYAHSGSNELPVQLAIKARQRGVIVVGVGPVKYAAIAPKTVDGNNLFEVVDFEVDKHDTPGDALVEIGESDLRVAASLTVIGATIWNYLLTETVFRLQPEGEGSSITASLNIPETAEHNKKLLGSEERSIPIYPTAISHLKGRKFNGITQF